MTKGKRIKMDDNDLMFGNQFKNKKQKQATKKTVKRSTKKK